MKSKNVIEKIKDVLNLNEEVKLEQTKLENGTVIEAESFEEGKEVFIAPNATVIGNIELGDESSVWFGAVLRADSDKIIIGNRTNIFSRYT